MEIVRTREEIYHYLIQPSHLFLKQVIDIAETKNYILIMDVRKTKKRIIPDMIISKFEDRINYLRQYSCNCKDYDGVNYLLIPKVNITATKVNFNKADV